jgi:succinyl-diaminopimelate desuccinylase
MKGGVAVMLRCAHEVTSPARDVTYVFYDNEEVEAHYNGLWRIVRERPDWVRADFAILMEPSDAGIEAGCQGTMRVAVRTSGRRAHSARSWLGDNAIHRAGEILTRLADYQPAEVVVDGLGYREGLNAVGISGGVAGNVIPDECVVTVNYRFAPTRSAVAAEGHLREVFDGFDLDLVDVAAGAMPGLDRPAVREFAAAVGAVPRPKFGWTDVARFSELGIPAVNYGPGDPSFAHKRDEHVPLAQLREVESRLIGWLRSPA